MVLEPGVRAPEVRAENQHGERVEPAFDGAAVVYFYPRDDTPDCTTQAREFNAMYERFDAADVECYGVSTDHVDAHCDFAEEHELQFDLLADPDGEIADAFDVPVEDGRAKRTTFVVVRDQVVGVYEGVRAEGHAREVLRDLQEAGLVAMDDVVTRGA